jgi:hypothetical protein
MKKQKCPSCGKTQSDKAFRTVSSSGEKVLFEICIDCRSKADSERKREVKEIILNYARSLGMVKS